MASADLQCVLVSFLGVMVDLLVHHVVAVVVGAVAVVVVVVALTAA